MYRWAYPGSNLCMLVLRWFVFRVFLILCFIEFQLVILLTVCIYYVIRFLMSLCSAPPLALSGRFSALSSCHFRRRQEAYPMDIISLYIYDLLCNLVRVYLYIASWKSLLEITFWIWFGISSWLSILLFLEFSVHGWWSGRRHPSSAGWYVSFLIELLLSLTAKSTVKQ